ncbi:ROK family protein [Roseomonas haemaphysalidis]|uniref:ROK family protein n=1 Tax=Roseomonas haemaphysalidis TaxID=2768162 RepID=A0ABS3KVX2_9PROT|nr:ROK family protein [Roseomonas haemaphysalidis]MBO1081630.1 ROK family protein [Roseomonas haemaphysalidis]
MSHHIGIDLGGTKVEVALTGARFDTPLLREREPTERRGVEPLVAQLARLVRRARDAAGGPVTLGLGLPGSIETGSGQVRNCVLPWLDGAPLAALLREATGLPPAIINDAHAFALSEARLGAGRGHRMVLGLTLGTGIGGGLVVDGALWPGRHGIAGEWGHACLEPGGRRCYCGRQGCAEQYLSGTALERRYRALGGEPAGLAAIAARAGTDPLAARLLDEAAAAFGRAVGNWVNLLDPDVIVLGGGASALPLWFDQGREAVARQAMAAPFTTPIRPASLGHSSGVLGAALIGAEALAAI